MSITPSQSAPSLHWPQFLLAEKTGSFLWGEGREILRIRSPESGPVVLEPAAADLRKGLNKLVAAAQAPDGTLAVLDVSGRVSSLNPTSGQISSFETHLQNRPGDLALTKDRVFVLLQGESEESSAVVGYTLNGVEVGKWGTMPPDGIVQASLRGGGLAACPNGSVFYSYINSARIFRLENDAKKGARAIGASSPFTEISAREVQRAQRESRYMRSVAPLVKLGLRASRVMALRCSQEGLLFRQVARPAGGGAQIEVWDPPTGKRLGTIPTAGGILLDVQDRTLYLGINQADQSFRLDRVQFQIGPSRPTETAKR